MTPRLILDRRRWLSAAGLLALAGCAGRSKEEPIWIGHIGPAGKRGESAINGMQQMLADLKNDEFTVVGRSLGVRHVEAKDKSRARAEASRLLAVNRVACLIVGPEVEGVAEVCAIARAHEAIAVVLGGTSDRALAEQAVWLGIDPETAGGMLARYAVANGLKAYTSDLKAENEVLRGFAREFAKGDKPLGAVIGPKKLSPRINYTTAPGEGAQDRRPPTHLQLGPGGRPELKMPNAPAGEVWTLRMQPGPASRVADDRIRGDNLLAGLAQAVAESESLPANGRAWAERYEKRFGLRPDDEAILGAEAVALIADGLREVVRDDREKLTKELEGRTEVAGLTGPVVWKDWRARRPMWVERVVKGKRVAVEPVPTNE